MNHWVALDWGTSNFRAYLMENNNVIDQVSTQEGMKFVDQKEFETTLLKNITAWRKKFKINIVIASGMVGAKQGWIEVPYINSPCDIRNLNFKTLNILDDTYVLSLIHI